MQQHIDELHESVRSLECSDHERHQELQSIHGNVITTTSGPACVAVPSDTGGQLLQVTATVTHVQETSSTCIPTAVDKGREQETAKWRGVVSA